jgi:hypothetical protein
MKRLWPLFSVCSALLVWTQFVAAEPLAGEEQKAVLKLANDFKAATLSKDHETIVSLLYPEMVKAAGGREKMVQMLKAEDDKNQAAGVKIESLDLEAPEFVHTGSKFRVGFVTSTMVAKVNDVRIRSKSFFVAFAQLGTRKWHLVDGTKMTDAQFRQLFSGLPTNVKLPAVERTQL